MTVSLVGDGIFLVAMAWQVYSVWNAPAALSMVGIAMTVPTIVCLLPGGVVSDRLSRRAIMLAADAVRAAAIAVLAVLSLTGRIQVWEIAALAMVYGAGTAFFTPAFEALVPDILPDVRPAGGQLARPVRAPDRPAPGRPRGGAGSSRPSARASPSPPTPPRSRRQASPCWRCARWRGHAHARRVDDGRHQEGLHFIRQRPGSGGRWSRPRSPTCSSSARPRCSCPTWSRTACTGRPARWERCSPRAGSARSGPRC